MRLLLTVCLALVGLACDKTIHEVRWNAPAEQTLQAPPPQPVPA